MITWQGTCPQDFVVACTEKEPPIRGGSFLFQLNTINWNIKYHIAAYNLIENRLFCIACLSKITPYRDYQALEFGVGFSSLFKLSPAILLPLRSLHIRWVSCRLSISYGEPPRDTGIISSSSGAKGWPAGSVLSTSRPQRAQTSWDA